MSMALGKSLNALCPSSAAGRTAAVGGIRRRIVSLLYADIEKMDAEIFTYKTWWARASFNRRRSLIARRAMIATATFRRQVMRLCSNSRRRLPERHGRSPGNHLVGGPVYGHGSGSAPVTDSAIAEMRTSRNTTSLVENTNGRLVDTSTHCSVWFKIEIQTACWSAAKRSRTESMPDKGKVRVNGGEAETRLEQRCHSYTSVSITNGMQPAPQDGATVERRRRLHLCEHQATDVTTRFNNAITWRRRLQFTGEI